MSLSLVYILWLISVVKLCNGQQEDSTNDTGYQCKQPMEFKNGYYNELQNSTSAVSTTIHAVCNSGYILVGYGTRTCKNDGTWSGGNPVCSIVKCDIPFETNANFESSSRFNAFTDTATYNMTFTIVCNKGYTMVVSTIRCESDGHWTTAGPYCVHNSTKPNTLHTNCSTPNDLQNGLYSYNTFSMQNGPETIHAICNKGFTLRGNGTRACQYNGTWSGQNPVCSIVKCDIPFETDASFEATSRFNAFTDTATYNMTFKIVCNKGYTTAVSIIRCESDGHWTTAGPYCVHNSTKPNTLHTNCSTPNDLQNGFYSYNTSSMQNGPQTIHAICNESFTLQGNGTRTCQYNGSWSGESPVCSIVKCDIPFETDASFEPTSPFNAFTETAKYNMSFNIVCSKGYTKVVSNIRCEGDGNWTTAGPYCVQNSTKPNTLRDNCSTPIDLRNGYYTFNNSFLNMNKWHSFKYDTVLGIVCINGYRTFVNIIICMPDGRWNARPACSKDVCILPRFNHGYYRSRQNASSVTVIQYSDVVVPVCVNDSYQLQTLGGAESTCMADGVLNGGDPACVICVVPNITNGVYVDGAGSQPRGAQTYDWINPMCDPGYGPSYGDTRLICQADSTWSGQVSTCTEIKPEATKSASRSTVIAAAVGGGFAGVLIVIAVVSLYFYRKRRNVRTTVSVKNERSSSVPVEKERLSVQVNHISVLIQNSKRVNEYVEMQECEHEENR